MLHIYTGDGKGKTTAAMGLCLRAAGHGYRVGIAQFLKDGKSGELTAFSKMENVRLFDFLPDVKFTFAMNEREKRQAHDFYTRLLTEIDSEAGNLDLLLLDEILPAVTTGMLDEEAVLRFLNRRRATLEVVLTGRDCPPAISRLADYISDIRMVRHPYEKGIPARKGIEW